MLTLQLLSNTSLVFKLALGSYNTQLLNYLWFTLSVSVHSEDAMETLSHVGELGETTEDDQQTGVGLSNGALPGYSSIETLLMNIQGLLKVAGENARHQERQICKSNRFYP